MSFEGDLKTHLQAGCAALVADRIYPLVRFAGSTLPALTYTLVAESPQNSISGFTSGVTKYRVQVDCWATTHAAMMSVKAAVKTQMNLAAVATAGFTSIMEFGQDIYEEETKIYRSILDFSCSVIT